MSKKIEIKLNLKTNSTICYFNNKQLSQNDDAKSKQKPFQQ